MIQDLSEIAFGGP